MERLARVKWQILRDIHRVKIAPCRFITWAMTVSMEQRIRKLEETVMNTTLQCDIVPKMHVTFL